MKRTLRTLTLSALLLILTVCGLLFLRSASLSWEDVRHYVTPAFYRVTTAPSPAGPWEYLATLPSSPTSGTMTVQVPVTLATNEPARFYRVARFFHYDRADDSLRNIRLNP